jgi:hypothetical protein
MIRLCYYIDLDFPKDIQELNDLLRLLEMISNMNYKLNLVDLQLDY